jgi:DNA-binding transcriptional ArsR family regulator
MNAAAAATVDAFRAIADPTRREILDLLAARDRGVTEIGARFAVSQPAISQHLKVLREAGLVEATRDGKRQIYRVRPEGFAPVRAWMAQYERFWTEKLDRLGALLDGALAPAAEEHEEEEEGDDDAWEPPPPPPPMTATTRPPRAGSSTRRSGSSASTPTRGRRSGRR